MEFSPLRFVRPKFKWNFVSRKRRGIESTVSLFPGVFGVKKISAAIFSE
jgi:hypothetical protein